MKIKQAPVILSLIISAGIIFGAVYYANSDRGCDDSSAVCPISGEFGAITDRGNNTQIIRIIAHGGYSPRQISAKAGVPMRIEMETKGTYDCSSVFVIPSLKYQKRLPPTGVTVIDVPAQKSGSSLTGLCGMGMYSFEIEFN